MAKETDKWYTESSYVYLYYLLVFPDTASAYRVASTI